MRLRGTLPLAVAAIGCAGLIGAGTARAAPAPVQIKLVDPSFAITHQLPGPVTVGWTISGAAENGNCRYRLERSAFDITGGDEWIAVMDWIPTGMGTTRFTANDLDVEGMYGFVVQCPAESGPPVAQAVSTWMMHWPFEFQTEPLAVDETLIPADSPIEGRYRALQIQYARLAREYRGRLENCALQAVVTSSPDTLIAWVRGSLAGDWERLGAAVLKAAEWGKPADPMEILRAADVRPLMRAGALDLARVMGNRRCNLALGMSVVSSLAADVCARAVAEANSDATKQNAASPSDDPPGPAPMKSVPR